MMPGSSEPLRIGLLVDTLQQPAWVRQIIADIQASQYARIVLVVKKDAPPKARASFAQRIWRRRSRLAYLAYRWLDERAFRTSPDAFARQDTTDLLSEAAVVRATVRETRFCDYLTDDALAQIRDAHPDVLLRFGFRILKGPILDAARYGVWSYHHGDNQVNRGGPAGFWEVMHEHPTTGSVLQILNEDLDNGRVICRSYAKTDRSSVWRNRNNYYWKSAAFVTRALRQLADCGPAAIEGCSRGHGSREPHFYSERLFRKPDNLQTIALVGRYLTRRVSERVRRIREVDQWAIAFSLSKAAPSTTLYRFKEQWPPIGSSWADPFPVAAPDGYHIFLEVYDRATKRGHIGVSRLTREGKFDRPVTVLDRPYHLSYPFVFRWRDTWFMMPESSNAARIEVFSARQFPFEWTPEAILFESVHAVDATLVSVEGRWWLFANVSPHPTIRNYDELHAFHGPTPFGPWTAHRRNPVKSDARSARGAGRFFWKGQALFRPSQDCSDRYGSAIVINRVDRLTPDAFQETIVGRIDPHWRAGLTGTHTLNSCSDLTVVDFRHRRAKYSSSQSSS
jgi:hypothetical protein